MKNKDLFVKVYLLSQTMLAYAKSWEFDVVNAYEKKQRVLLKDVDGFSKEELKQIKSIHDEITMICNEYKELLKLDCSVNKQKKVLANSYSF